MLYLIFIPKSNHHGNGPLSEEDLVDILDEDDRPGDFDPGWQVSLQGLLDPIVEL